MRRVTTWLSSCWLSSRPLVLCPVSRWSGHWDEIIGSLLRSLRARTFSQPYILCDLWLRQFFILQRLALSCLYWVVWGLSRNGFLFENMESTRSPLLSIIMHVAYRNDILVYVIFYIYLGSCLSLVKCYRRWFFKPCKTWLSGSSIITDILLPNGFPIIVNKDIWISEASDARHGTEVLCIISNRWLD